MVQPITAPGSAVDRAKSHLEGQILSGKLAAGDRLPPERELAASLAINRITLRAALGQLAAANLLTVRQGSGYVVRPWRRDGGPELLRAVVDWKVPGGDLPTVSRDLLLVRRHLAAAVLERLADGITPAARAAIDAAVHAYRARAEVGVAAEEAAELDLKVLEAILSASGSPVLALCLNPISAVLRDLPGLRRAMYADARAGAQAYTVLLTWLDRGTKDQIPAILAVLAARDEATLAALAAPSTKTARAARTRRAR